jgi:hypothetical protein
MSELTETYNKIKPEIEILEKNQCWPALKKQTLRLIDNFMKENLCINRAHAIAELITKAKSDIDILIYAACLRKKDVLFLEKHQNPK